MGEFSSADAPDVWTPPSIRVDLTLSLSRYDDSAVRTFEGRILALGDEDASEPDETVLGHVRAQLVDTYRSSFRLDADAESDDLHTAVIAVCDQDGIRSTLSEMPAGGMVLHIDRVFLEPAYRGQGIGLTVVRRTVRGLGVDCVLAVMQPAPTEPAESDDATRRVGRRKLQRYWSQLGFTPVPQNRDIYYLDLTIEHPELNEAD